MLIVWDYFGVLAQDSFWYTAERIAEGNGRSEEVKTAQHDADLGKIGWDEYVAIVARDVAMPLDVVAERYQHHDINKAAILTIKSLPNHTHVVLSNASHTYLLDIMDRLGLNAMFDRVFVSSQIGFAKPDPRAFQHILQQMSCEPAGAIMIDDSARNVDAARALGMRGLVYEKSVDLGTELRRAINTGS